MTKDQIQNLFVFYDGYFEGQGVTAIKSDHTSDLPSRNEPHSLEHVRWMCQEAQTFEDDGKANRWLGFIQGCLWCREIFSIDEMREHNTADEATQNTQ